MYTINKKLTIPFYLLLSVILSSCNGAFGTYELAGQDGPVDNPLYAEIYVTIDEIRIDGQKIDDFERQTINFASLTNGLTQDLCKADVSEGSYQNVTLVLDFEQDAKGEAPGCYANTIYGRKIDLSNGRSGKQEIEIAHDFDIKEGQTSKFVMDFDLRKSVRPSMPGDQDELSLVSVDGIKDAIHFVEASETGDLRINLSLDNAVGQTTTYYVAYLYPRGGFDKLTETFDTDGDGITYENAFTSGKLDFASIEETEFAILSYLPAGEYDLILEAYEKYEFSSFSIGYLKIQGEESPIIPLSISIGETTELTLKGTEVIQ